ncbi:MAG: alpha-hydroxy-acid oxidizing protein, partial [Microbacterium gubbeenense]
MVQRQFPKPAEVMEFLKIKLPEFGKDARLKKAFTVYDLRDIAKRRTPAAAFDYTDGAADQELSMTRARQAFEDIEFHPDILKPAANVDTTTQILGGTSAMPFGIAPTGFTRLMQTEGETAGAGAAGAAGIPFTLS